MPARRTRPRGRASGRRPSSCVSAHCVLEVGRLAEGAGALAGHWSDSLVVSYHSDDFAKAQHVRQALGAVGALCAVLRRTAGDARDRLAGVEPELPGFTSC